MWRARPRGSVVSCSGPSSNAVSLRSPVSATSPIVIHGSAARNAPSGESGEPVREGFDYPPVRAGRASPKPPGRGPPGASGVDRSGSGTAKPKDG